MAREPGNLESKQHFSSLLGGILSAFSRTLSRVSMLVLVSMALIRMVLLMSLMAASAHAGGALSADQAERYMKRSGLNEMLLSLQDSIAQRLDLSRLRLAGIEVDASTQAALTHALAEVDAQKIARDYIMSSEADAQLQQTLSFLESPLGHKITDAESAASAPEAQQAMHAHSLQMAQTPPPKERNELIDQLVKEAHMSESVLLLMERLVLMPGDLAVHLANTEKASSFKQELDQEWGNMRPALMLQFEQLVSMSAHYSYRELSNDELSQYIAFLSKPQGQAYWQTSLELVDKYLNQFVDEFVKLLSEKT